MNPWYKDYSEHLAERFPGMKVQKLSVDAGFSCPNRDGTIGFGGCSYCDNRSFTPGYCDPADSVGRQLHRGKEFFARKYPEMKYLAYFQSFTGTHSSAIEKLEALYQEALSQPDVVGLVIGTRPDTLPPDVIALLAEINRTHPVIVEIGAETSHDITLCRVNRCHTWSRVCDAVTALNAEGIETGLHLIAGLPGETEDDILTTIRRTLQLPVAGIKLHQLQIIRSTPLHNEWEKRPADLHIFTLEEYLDLCVKVVRTVGRRITIERFLASAPPDMVVAPKWGLKNYEFVNLLHNRLKRSD